MKIPSPRLAVLLLSALFLTLNSCKENTAAQQRKANDLKEKREGYDGPAERIALEFKKTVDPALGVVPRDRLAAAITAARASKVNSTEFVSGYGDWVERGPTSDVVGISNGNTRANSAVTAGRMRAILVDAGDPTGNTVWVGGVDGGIWKTTDITVNPANWTLVNDFLVNLAVTDICQDPTNSNTMYYCTGEAFYNVDAVRGAGIFKSVDHGVTWTQLASTANSNFYYCTKLITDPAGNLYASTRSGLFRSTNGGTNWTNITPAGIGPAIGDIKLSSTGRLHVGAGDYFTTSGYRYTDIPLTASSASFTAPVAGFPAAPSRLELSVNGNTLYACPADGTDQVPTIYKSTDGGMNWAPTLTQPPAGWASGQAWYCLTNTISPANPDHCIVGGLDNYRTLDGGVTWVKISEWVGTFGQYVHADQQDAYWYPTGDRFLFGSDGGIFYSADITSPAYTVRDRNTGLRIKQFYAVAAHPTNLNYFLAGAQDNGSHALTQAGLSTSIEVTGGDGAFVHIDQDQPQYQFTSYVYNQYRRSTNGGTNWGSVNLSNNTGQFINPTDYDDVANIMYCANTAGTFRRWNDPQTGSSNTVVTVPELNSSSVLAVTVSPYGSHRVYFGTAGGRVVLVSAANTAVTGSVTATNLSTGLPAAAVSCIAVGSTDQNLIATYSNYGVQQVWISTTGGASWTNIDGNLPDMPVRWAMFYPGDNSKVILATETGVWVTQAVNGGSTVWLASPSFPIVRTDMLQYRPLDQMIVAATHGRGVWTQPFFSVVPLNNFKLRGAWAGKSADLNWNYSDLPQDAKFEVEVSEDARTFRQVGSISRNNSGSYNFKYMPNGSMFYRIRAREANGASKYSNVVRLLTNGASGMDLKVNTFYPNPVRDNLTVSYFAPAKGTVSYMITTAAGAYIWHREEYLAAPGNFTATRAAASLRPGTYIFTIILNGQKVSQTFVKQ